MNMNDEIEKLVIMMAVQPLIEEAAKEVEKMCCGNGIKVECSMRVKDIDVNLFKKKMKERSKATHGAVKTVEAQIGDALFRVREDASDGEEKK